jgi:hypothetical protein
MDIKEAEVDSIADITAFLDAELAYYDSCRDVLLNLRQEWPGEGIRSDICFQERERVTNRKYSGHKPRPRSNTARSHSNLEDDSPVREKAPILPTRTRPRDGDSPQRNTTIRPSFSRSVTQESSRDEGQAQGIYKLVRIPTEPTAIVQARAGNLRPVASAHDEEHFARSDSPMSRAGTTPSRTTSWSGVDTATGPKKSIPPPVNRTKKPPPPPPPMKRSTLSTSQISTQSEHY